MGECIFAQNFRSMMKIKEKTFLTSAAILKNIKMDMDDLGVLQHFPHWL